MPAAGALRLFESTTWMPSSPDNPGDSPDTDVELVRRAAAGDRRAAESLLRELLPRMRNLVRYLVRGDGDTDDIAQEAMIAVMRGLGSFRGDGKLQSWVDRIVARTTFAHIRRVRKEAGGRAELENQVGLAIVPEPGAPPDRFTQRRELAAKLDELPDEQRHALVLHHAVGMTVPEIAAELEVSPDTIKSRLRLGRSKMRAMLGTEGGAA